MKRQAVKKATRARAGGGSPQQPPEGSRLAFANLQRAKRLNLALLKTITQATLAELPNVTAWDLGFYLVGARKMAGINESHLNHEGPTDVITFDYSERGTPSRERGARNAERGIENSKTLTLVGEVFICVDVAVTQAREFRTSWQAEIARYIVHALLHLCGYDDLTPAARREMKQHENRLVRHLARAFPLAAIARPRVSE
jgi:probable rRNA maturation factor